MKLLLAIPTLENVPVEFLASLIHLVEHLKDEDVDFSVRMESNTLVYFAREELVRYALVHKFTHVLWLDSDMVFTPEIVEDLMFSGK